MYNLKIVLKNHLESILDSQGKSVERLEITFWGNILATGLIEIMAELNNTSYIWCVPTLYFALCYSLKIARKDSN